MRDGGLGTGKPWAPYLEESNVATQQDDVDGEHDGAEGHDRKNRLRSGQLVRGPLWRGYFGYYVQEAGGLLLLAMDCWRTLIVTQKPKPNALATGWDPAITENATRQ